MRLSIVIPTLNEVSTVAAAVRHSHEHTEDVVVSDGSSQDGTLQRAAEAGARTVSGPAGRGPQLNRGALAASGEVLLFLHADTTLPQAANRKIVGALAAGAIGGGFRVHFDSPRPIFHLGDGLVNLRTRLTGCPLGDQAQFATRSAFEAIGGFNDWPILEDLDFIRRLKRHGRTITLSPPVRTSARRFERQGIARTVATNWLIWVLYFAGISPIRLAALYDRVR